MAHAITSTDVYPKAPLRERLTAWMIDTINMIGENNPRLRRARKLQAMTDNQLATLGIERQDIAHLVFRDVYYG